MPATHLARRSNITVRPSQQLERHDVDRNVKRDTVNARLEVLDAEPVPGRRLLGDVAVRALNTDIEQVRGNENGLPFAA